MQDGKRDSDGTVGKEQKPGALKIYDGALSDEFSDDFCSTTTSFTVSKVNNSCCNHAHASSLYCI